MKDIHLPPTRAGVGHSLLNNLGKDFPASIVVFLVALPLCLGIALASGAPLFAGLLTGIIGGLVTASISGSQLSVSGPAAGLTVIVAAAIISLGNYQTFLLAVLLAGVLQLLLSFLKAGTIASYFPSAVIEGMLAAIGIILILKQLPHAVGYDADYEGSVSFQGNQENTFSTLMHSVRAISIGPAIISMSSLIILVLWPRVKKLRHIPGPLVVVALGVFLNKVFSGTSFSVQDDQLVRIPIVNGLSDLASHIVMPDFSHITDPQVWTVALTIAIVASLESLLSLEAVDKIDPLRRVSPTNRELLAQGTGNIVSGLLGGLPMTAVIVRSSANANAGARSRASAIMHGCWLFLSLLFIPGIINTIPLSSLAAILLFTGYKLARLSLFKKMYREGWNQFVPFIVTITAVVLIDLLRGVAIGMVIGIFYILRNNMRNPYCYTISKNGAKKQIHIQLAEEVSFLNKAAISRTLNQLPQGVNVIIDGSNSRYIDHDVLEIINNFKHSAYSKGIIVQLKDIKKCYDIQEPEKVSVGFLKNEDPHTDT